MPVHVEEMNTEVTVIDGDLPLTEKQVEKLVQIVLRRLEGKKREEQKIKDATTIRRSVVPPMRVGE